MCTGLDLQRELARRQHAIPIVFITALGDESLRPRLIAGGVVDRLLKLFSGAVLLAAVNAALGRRS